MGLLDADGGLLAGLLSRIDAMKRRGADMLLNPRDTLLSGYGFGPEFGAEPSNEYRTEAQRGLLGSAFPEVRQAGRDAALAHQREQYGAMLDVGLNAPGLLGHIVYHGSPHLFDKFDIGKIGTGEGAQAYGHGLYFAENPQVSKQYSLAGNGQRPFIDNAPADTMRLGGAESMLLNMYHNRLAAGLSPEKAAAQTEKWGASHPQIGSESAAQFTKRLSAPKGNLYKVDIPDEAIGRMLDWDKPLSQQPQAVRELVAARPDVQKKLEFQQSFLGKEPSGLAIYTAIAGGPQHPSAASASDVMRQAGIPGIKYLDQGSRSSGNGTSNYVLFDADLAKILERQ